MGLLLPGTVLAGSPETVRLADATTVAPIVDAWAALLPAAGGPEARVVARGRFPTDAIKALVEGRADLAVIARELFASEAAALRALGRGEPRLIPVATGTRSTRGGTHAIAIFVNEANPLARLSLEQLAEVLADDGTVRTWGDLGVGGPLAGQRVAVHGMITRRESGDPPGIVNFLERRVLRGRRWREDLTAHRDEPGGVAALEAIVRAVAGEVAALGYSGFDYGHAGAKPVAVGETTAGPFLAGAEEEVARREYPLCRTVYLCLPAASDAAAYAFARMALGAEGQAAIASSGTGFHALPEAMREEIRHGLPLAPPRGASYVDETGVIQLAGYNDMDQMVRAWCLAFGRHHPGFRFAVDLRGTRVGPPALAAGTAAFVPMGAEFSAAQLAEFRRAGAGDPVVFRVAHASMSPRALSGPLAIVVHPDNPLEALTLAEVAAIFSGEDKTRGLRPVGLEADTALGLFFQERVLGNRPRAAGFVGHRQSAQVIEQVGRDPAAIGYAAAVRLDPGVKVLALAEGPGVAPVRPTEQSIHQGIYPLDRHLLIAFRSSMEPWMIEFMRFVLSAAGQELVREGERGYLPLNERERVEEREKLERQRALGARPPAGA